MKKKLLVYSSYLGSGGAEKHTVRILNKFPESNIDILIVSANKYGEYENELNPNIVIQKIGSSILYNISSTLGRVSTIFDLKKLIKKYKPDVILSIQDLQNVIILKIFKRLKYKPKLILVVQNSVKDAYKSKWNPIHKLVLNSIKYEYQNADKIIALSEGVKEGLIELNPLLADKVELIYNAGLDDDMVKKLNKMPRQEISKTPILISCGRLTPQKGYVYMFEALKLLKEENIPFHYNILGRGELEKELKELAVKLELENHVSFLGFQSNPYEYMSAADIFVLPSIYEGFGNVIVEALACKLPVISTRCPHGPEEILQNGEYGILVEYKNPEELASAIKRMINKPELRDSFIEKGFERANAFHANKIGHQYYQSILHTLNV